MQWPIHPVSSQLLVQRIIDKNVSLSTDEKRVSKACIERLNILIAEKFMEQSVFIEDDLLYESDDLEYFATSDIEEDIGDNVFDEIRDDEYDDTMQIIDSRTRSGKIYSNHDKIVQDLV